MISEKSKIGAVLVLAAALRLTGIHYGLPELYHQDEPIMANHAMALGVSGGNPHFFIIGSFGLYFLFFLYAVYYVLGGLAGVFPDTQAFASAFLTDPTMFYLLGRVFLGAAFGTATVWVVYRIARKRFSERAAFWSALFLAVLPLHAQHSHYIYADVPLALAVLLMLDSMQDLAEKPSFGAYAKAGALGGWALAVKFTAFYFLPAALLAHAFAWKGARSLSAPALVRFFTALAAGLAVFFAITPFALISWPEFYSQVTAQTGAESRVGWLHHLVYSLAGGSGILFLFLAGIGFAAGFKKNPRLWTVWGAACVFYYLINVFFSQPFARYMMPLVPLLALWAGYGVAALLETKALPRTLVFAFAAAAVAEIGPVTVYSDLLFMRRDTRAECREWIEANVPDGSPIAVDNRFFAPRLSQTQEQLRQKYAWIDDSPKSAVRKMRLDLELRLPEEKKRYTLYVLKPGAAGLEPKFVFEGPYLDPAPSALSDAGIRYLIFNGEDSPLETAALKEELGEQLERVAVFDPYRDKSGKGVSDPFSNTAAPHLARRIFERERLGPYLEVYRVKS